MKFVGGLAPAVAALTLCSCIGFRAGAAEQGSNPEPRYAAQLLPGIGGVSIAARALNDAGVVVGAASRANGYFSAFRFERGKTQDLGGSASQSMATAVDDSGAVFGSVWNNKNLRRAAAFGGPEPQVIPLEGDWLNTTVVAALSPSLIAVTAEGNGTAVIRSYLLRFEGSWHATEVYQDSLVDQFSVSAMGFGDRMVGSATALVGRDGTRVGDSRAFLLVKKSLMDLGTLPGGIRSEATSVNREGLVAGWSETRTAAAGGWHWARHAFIASGPLMKDLGTLGGDESWANAVAADGTVVGASEDKQHRKRAFCWSGGNMQDLNGLVRPAEPACILEEAVGINSRGQIAAHGRLASSAGQICSVLLTPLH
jgi:probable HAF family extracellular repeat protein